MPIWAQLGTRNAALVPSVHFGWGVRTTSDGSHVEIFVPAPFLGGLRENLAENGRVALTFSEPATHESYQLKGRSAELREPTAEERTFQEEWGTKFAALIRKAGIPEHLVEVFGGIGKAPSMYLRIHVEQTFVQTPGPTAGTALPMEGG